MSAHDKLNVAEQVERTAARLYRLLTETFPPGSEANKVFSTLASEEDQHAARINMLRSRYSRRPGDFEGFELDVEQMSRLLGEGETLITLFSGEGFSVSVDEARRFMIELERNFAGAHAQVMTLSSNPELKSFFETLARQDRMHAQVLEDLRGGDEARPAGPR